MLGSPFLRPSEGLRSPSVGPRQSCSAWTIFSPFPLFNLFFQDSKWMHGAAGSHADPLAPQSPLTPCELPKGPPQALLHIGTPQPLSGAGHWAWDCHPWMSFKKLWRKTTQMLRSALVMPSSPQAQLQSDTFPADGGSRSTALDGPQEALQSCVSFSGRRLGLGCSASLFSGYEAMSVEAR